MKKIFCEEKESKDFDNYSMKELKEMIGWIETPDEKDGKWIVNMIDGCFFGCVSQETAQIIASQEEIKALLMK